MSEKRAMPIKKGDGWKTIPIGGIIPEGGTAEAFKTGDWRTMRPVHHPDRCIHCMQCWAYCPDMSIQLNEDGTKVIGIDLEHCKGCLLCVKVCPDKVEALTSISETEAAKND